MGYVYLVYSSSQRSLALKARSQLETLRITVWVRDPALDRKHSNERIMIESALASASVFLLVWHAATDQTTPQARVILQEVSQAHERRLPILVLEHERDLPAIIQRVQSLLPNESGVPLPIPYDMSDNLRNQTLAAERRRPQRRLIAVSLIALIGTIVLIGLIVLTQNNLQASFQAPELPTLTVTATDTLTSSPTITPSPTQTPQPSHTPTDVPPTATDTPTSSPTLTLTSTPTLTLTSTPTLTATPRPSPTLTATPTPFISFATNTPAS